MFGYCRILNSSKNCIKNLIKVQRAQSTMAEVEGDLLRRAQNIVPPLDNALHKGQAGRIGIVGGSEEYTGAPYFAGISAFRTGADLVHVFCCKDAAPVIKSYSPDLIVHPILDVQGAMEKMIRWLDRLHILVIGPGLGRDQNVLDTVSELLRYCRHNQIKVILDADALHLITLDMTLIKDLNGAILTPNAIEFERLFGSNRSIEELQARIGRNVTILEKGLIDKVYDVTDTNKIHYGLPGGSARRCGGQGDLLSGALATFYFWALNNQNEPNPAIAACIAATFLIKNCNALAFEESGRGTLCCDMVKQIPIVFKKYFERKI